MRIEKLFGDILDRSFKLREREGENKVVSLPEAIRRNVRPGMRLHFGREANAAALEVVRQYYGTQPHFTLVMGGTLGYVLNLIHCGLVDRLITSMSTHLHPTPGPVRLLQSAIKEKRLQIENWSMWTLHQRLIAGAWGVPFLPTNSLCGTGMAEENVDCFQEMEDPFGSGRKCGLVKALDVDLSLIHACAADPYGNTLLPAPYDETLWAPRASKNGVIVTVEQIVSTQFIREHSGLVRLPGYLVSSVSLVPLGAHPLCLVNPGVRDFIGYGADYDFMLDYRHSLNDLAALDAWIKEWVLDCPSHDHYLAKLGQERIQLLRSKSEENAWQQELESLSGQLSTEVKFNDTEMMIVAAARKIKQRIVAQGYRTLLTGIGAAGLAAWMAYLQLQEEGYGLDLLFGSGQYGFSPRPADPFMFNISNIPTCKMLSDFSEVYGVWAGGATNKCLVVLGAAQVDKHGNLNSSKINDLFLIGAGGAADSVNSQETMVVGRQSKNRFVEKASYISVPGNKVKTLVTNLGVFEKISDDTEFTVTQFCPEWSATAGQDPVRRVKDNCGWELKISQKVTQVSRPTQEELIMLRLLDPQAAYIGA